MSQEEARPEEQVEQTEESMIEEAEKLLSLKPQDTSIEEEPVVEEPSEPEYSETEREAMRQGWIPPDKFSDPDKEAVSAEVFLGRQPVFEKLKKVRELTERETRQLKEQVAKLRSEIKQERQRGYRQALADLEAKRREAIELADVDEFDRLDKEYSRVHDEIKELEAVDVEPIPEEIQLAPEAEKFIESNADWFNDNGPENISMKNQAIEIEKALDATKPYLTIAQKLKAVEDEIKGLYPHRFHNPKKAAPSKVEVSQPDKTVGKRSSKAIEEQYEQLSPAQREACAFMLSVDPDATVEDYIKNLR